MRVQWPVEFDQWVRRLQAKSREGHAYSDRVVVALFAGEKARIGDAWYDSVGHRADIVIEQWRREKEREDDD